MTIRLQTLLILIIAATAAAVAAPSALADRPPTLFKWTSDQPDEGGSKLEEPLETDRPDFTEAATTVGQGVVQLEMGYTFTADDSAGVRTGNHSFPEALLRVGMLADWLEFRVEWNYEVEQTRIGGFESTASGADDMVFGFKIALTEQEDYLPETAIILQMSVPTGSSEFTGDEVLPGVNYCFSWELGEDSYLAGSTALNGATDDETTDTYSQFSQSLSAGHKWTEKIGNYTEWYVLSPIGADTNRPEHYLNGGFTYLFNNDVQWDIRAGVGLNEAADNFFAGSGLSLRYY